MTVKAWIYIYCTCALNSLTHRRVGVHLSIADARSACQEDGGSLLDYQNANDSRCVTIKIKWTDPYQDLSVRTALEDSFTEFRIQGRSEGTCWIDGQGNEVETNVQADGGEWFDLYRYCSFSINLFSTSCLQLKMVISRPWQLALAGSSRSQNLTRCPTSARERSQLRVSLRHVQLPCLLSIWYFYVHRMFCGGQWGGEPWPRTLLQVWGIPAAHL